MNGKSYMYSPPVVDSIIPFVSDTDYGAVLSTCKEINYNFDRNTEWKKRLGLMYCVQDPKKLCLLRDVLKRRDPLDILNNVTSVKMMKTLMYGYRKWVPLGTTTTHQGFAEYKARIDCSRVSTETLKDKVQIKYDYKPVLNLATNELTIDAVHSSNVRGTSAEGACDYPSFRDRTDGECIGDCRTASPVNGATTDAGINSGNCDRWGSCSNPDIDNGDSTVQEATCTGTLYTDAARSAEGNTYNASDNTCSDSTHDGSEAQCTGVNMNGVWSNAAYQTIRSLTALIAIPQFLWSR